MCCEAVLTTIRIFGRILTEGISIYKVAYIMGYLLELSVRWYTVVYILDVYIECLPRVS
jgi:hypothetical protein